MARVHIDLPERILFTTDLPVRITDLNYGGHLGNDAVLSFAQEARARFLASHGLSELDVGGGVGTAMVDATVVYRAEGKYGMVLRAEVAAAQVRTREFELAFRFTDVASGAEVARATTGLICFDYAARKIVRLPEGLRRALGAA
jgi:acyl-CoA thioester hydrolase